VLGFLRFSTTSGDQKAGSVFHDFDPARFINTDPRGWEKVSKMLFSADWFEPEDRQVMLSGKIASGTAGAFCDFIEMHAELPDVDAILRNPTSGTVPTEPSVLWVLSSAIAARCRNATGKLVEAAATYAQRLDREFQAAMMLDIVIAGGPKVHALPVVHKWTVENEHLNPELKKRRSA
jgi:hypothetical protein